MFYIFGKIYFIIETNYLNYLICYASNYINCYAYDCESIYFLQNLSHRSSNLNLIKKKLNFVNYYYRRPKYFTKSKEHKKKTGFEKQFNVNSFTEKYKGPA